jgi:asparagine synthase (glutamine-hydrolysing)
MCGFLGLLSLPGSAHPLPPPPVSRARIQWRGPDGSGQTSVRNFAVWHERLAIIDLSARASQPATSDDGEWHLAFNGEIYNYVELAERYGLAQAARTSDTVALCELIARLGVEGACQKIEGMFAFAAWSRNSGEVALARDWVGTKPLFWTLTPLGLLYGSDPLSLSLWRKQLGFEPALSPSAISNYLLSGYTGPRDSIWHGIYRVSPGAVLYSDGSKVREIPLNLRRTRVEASVARRGDLVRFADDALYGAVRSNLVADVDVGIFLSGGIDSSLLLALATKAGVSRMKSFSIGFDELSEHDETGTGSAIARIFDSDHVTTRMGSGDYLGACAEVAVAFPEPHGDPAALGMHALARVAAAEVKVVLTGEGGDELFGGYPRYAHAPAARLLARLCRPVGPMLVGALSPRRRAQFDALSGPAVRYTEFLASDSISRLSDLSELEIIDRAPLPRRLRLKIRDLTDHDTANILPGSYLDKTDRAGMRWGLEARVPLLDRGVDGVARSLPSHALAHPLQTKVLLRRVAASHLPREIAAAPKLGLRVPVERWLSHPAIRATVLESLLDGDGVRLGFLSKDGILKRFKTCDASLLDQSDGLSLHKLFMLECWLTSVRRASSNVN